VEYEVSGEKITLPVARLKSDLKKKADWISQHIRENEWLKGGYFNGYYDNNKQRVEGRINGVIRMTLTGQVFPVMSGIATTKQTKTLFKSCKRYLQHEKLGGFHLNTDFSRPSAKILGGIPPKAGKQELPALGRAFSFVYGDKENGAFFNHMAVMFSYALYKQGFAKEGYEVLNSIYRMAVNTEKSRIYPCLPEYFNAQGKGMYSYLTGSASWFILTLITQVFGIRGAYGDLVIEPKLTKQQFSLKNTICLSTSFAERKIEINFINPRQKDYGKYSIKKISLNGKIIPIETKTPHFIMRRLDFLHLADKPDNLIEVTLD
jgi:cellobiose phosphorylase